MSIIDYLRREEGESATVYQDSLSLWTIGVGRLVDGRKLGAGLTPDEIAYLLNNDVKAKTDAVLKALPWVAKLPEVRQAALIGMAFQMGVGGLLGFKGLLSAAQAGLWQTAAAHALDSTWAKQTPARAGRVAKMLITNQWQT